MAILSMWWQPFVYYFLHHIYIQLHSFNQFITLQCLHLLCKLAVNCAYQMHTRSKISICIVLVISYFLSFCHLAQKRFMRTYHYCLCDKDKKQCGMWWWSNHYSCKVSWHHGGFSIDICLEPKPTTVIQFHSIIPTTLPLSDAHINRVKPGLVGSCEWGHFSPSNLVCVSLLIDTIKFTDR